MSVTYAPWSHTAADGEAQGRWGRTRFTDFFRVPAAIPGTVGEVCEHGEVPGVHVSTGERATPARTGLTEPSLHSQCYKARSHPGGPWASPWNSFPL